MQPATTFDLTAPRQHAADDVRAVVAARDVRAVYQPIVDLASRQTVAFEALGRGPEGSALASPGALFPAAARAGLLGELDWACRAAAVDGALDAGLAPPLALFVNSEPATLGVPCPPDLVPSLERAATGLRVVVELTERALPDDPPAVLAAVARIRELGWGVALDDVGAHPDSLAMMPFIRPDVVKLDMSLIQGRTDDHVARVMNAVLAYAERGGAVVLAEGIETEEHLELARSLGATLGQGWLLGRPGPLDGAVPAAGLDGTLLPLLPTPAPSGAGTPFALAAQRREVRRATKRTLLAFSHHLEQQALATPESPVLLSAFQDAARFTPGTARRYERLVPRTALVGALGVGMDPEPLPGVRGGAISADDPLAGEWTVTVVGPHFSAALIAMDVGDDGPDLDRRFDYVLTYDRGLVVEAASLLLNRIVPTHTAMA